MYVYITLETIGVVGGTPNQLDEYTEVQNPRHMCHRMHVRLSVGKWQAVNNAGRTLTLVSEKIPQYFTLYYALGKLCRL